MKYTLILMMALAGCTQYKCVDGVMYVQMDKDIWIKDTLHNTPCITEVKK